MKKVLLLAITASISTLSFAQKFVATKTMPVVESIGFKQLAPAGTAAKLTAVGDTVYQTHINTAAGADTLSYYTYLNDTGALFGYNAFGDKGFAERYDINGVSASYKVIGVYALFGGTVQSGSTKTVDFNCWTVGPKAAITSTINNSGMPATSLATVNKPITSLGIGTGTSGGDVATMHYFPTPTAYLSDTFFIGYTCTYTWTSLGGDTIGLYSNLDGERSESAVTTMVVGDTTLNNVAVTQNSAGTWQDNTFFTGVFNNMAIFPLMVVGPGSGVGVEASITRKDFTFYNVYPNPANNTTNVKIALANAAEVTVDIMDALGKNVSTVNAGRLSAGDHSIAVNTANLAAGNYIYLIRTSTGNGIATQVTIAK